jgi:hypothetical protein
MVLIFKANYLRSWSGAVVNRTVAYPCIAEKDATAPFPAFIRRQVQSEPRDMSMDASLAGS